MACWRCPADELHIQTAQAECDLFIDRQADRFLSAACRVFQRELCVSQKDTKKADRDQQRQNSNAECILSYMQKADTEDKPNEASVVWREGADGLQLRETTKMKKRFYVRENRICAIGKVITLKVKSIVVALIRAEHKAEK